MVLNFQDRSELISLNTKYYKKVSITDFVFYYLPDFSFLRHAHSSILDTKSKITLTLKSKLHSIAIQETKHIRILIVSIC